MKLKEVREKICVHQHCTSHQRLQRCKVYEMTESRGICYRVVNEIPSHLKLTDSESFVYIKNPKYHIGEGIAGILTLPQSIPNCNKTIKFVLLLHGMQSHKNAIYQPRLAKRLAQLGYMVLRIDFRNNGDSESIVDDNKGRCLQRDLEDIETIYDLVTRESKLLLGGGENELSFDSIVSHSRGVISMFEFVRTTKACIRNLINCSARYEGLTLYDKLTKQHPNWILDNGYEATLLQHNKFVKQWIYKDEMLSFINASEDNFKQIDPQINLLSCYGALDDVVPQSAPSQFATLFHDHHHKLVIIPNANHNYYGHSNDPNILFKPLNKGRVDYNDDLTSVLVSFIAAG
ncbi:hypothetical protein TPHA_0B00870 [Tetrapisispora phaffii CBS 4417]|uniref:Serine aminopeptidase S33 domain-containing protein n=1 Tax=Tetrapisispora phaffii (strain ATCC 24235 / CBS 4417 / NBRC 1672 / NRRL Y-8282 / UCD 70-5) TaxID=1071381 RepID=G8BQG2_TETPH|nr:hypothetical protein TPHA_0B00870 [Tetrapisispora phaffii CBS 4417]CCE61759.1 hypothetical protein TPHA_0B00870 [Tetrapisispora phaffii CBS 4417]